MRDGRRATGEGLRGGGVVLSVPGGFTLVCRAAVGFLDRARGLLGTLPGRPLENALLLPDCPSVHTCDMAYPIDLAFFREDGSVARVCRNVGAWRVRGLPGAAAVAEREAFGEGCAAGAGRGRDWFRVGDVVEGFPGLLEALRRRPADMDVVSRRGGERKSSGKSCRMKERGTL